MSLRHDPELGPVRLCGTCHEEWPFDGEFWHMRDGDLSPAWPRRCRACCADYYASRQRIAMTITKAERVHLTPEDGRCGANLRSRRLCGRRAGHLREHRSVESMRQDAERQRTAA